MRENYLRVRLGQLTESQLLREAKLNKLNAFDHPAIFYIKAGNNSLG